MDKFEKKAYRQIGKTERFLKRLAKRVEREYSRMGEYNDWEDGNEDFDCPFCTLESILMALESGDYSEGGKKE